MKAIAVGSMRPKAAGIVASDYEGTGIAVGSMRNEGSQIVGEQNFWTGVRSGSVRLTESSGNRGIADISCPL